VIIDDEVLQDKRNRDKDKAERDAKPVVSITDHKLSSNQLKDLTIKMNLVAPNGLVSSAEMIDLLSTLAGYSKEFGTMELPSDWLTLDRTQFQQMTTAFVKYEVLYACYVKAEYWRSIEDCIHILTDLCLATFQHTIHSMAQISCFLFPSFYAIFRSHSTPQIASNSLYNFHRISRDFLLV
jgi:hypothetical protein